MKKEVSILLLIFAASFILAFFDLIPESSELDLKTAIVAIAIFITLLILWAIFYYKALRELSELDWANYMLGERNIILDDEGVSHTASDSSSFAKWSVFKGVTELDGILLLMMSSTTGVLIPLRSFESEAEKNDFIAFAESKINSH